MSYPTFAKTRWKWRNLNGNTLIVIHNPLRTSRPSGFRYKNMSYPTFAKTRCKERNLDGNALIVIHNSLRTSRPSGFGSTNVRYSGSVKQIYLYILVLKWIQTQGLYMNLMLIIFLIYYPILYDRQIFRLNTL